MHGRGIRPRTITLWAACALLLLIVILNRHADGGQGAVPLSRPGHEDISFWVDHDGLVQYDVESELGFGDMARILLRRRSNGEQIVQLRDRFTFKVRELAALQTPDVFRAEFAGGKLAWTQSPQQRLIAGSSRTVNIPVVIVNRDERELTLDATYTGPSMESAVRKIVVTPGAAAGVVLRAVESKMGAVEGKLSLRHDTAELAAPVQFDIRPLVKLRVRILDEQGRPNTARVYLTGSDGLAYTPRGSSTRITAMSAEYYFHAHDEFEIDMPAGQTLIEATRGPEYRVSTARPVLEPGKPAEVTLRLERWTNMTKQGFWSADAHIHANYTAPHHQVINPDDVWLQVSGEDLNYANMMVANSGGAFIHDRQYFEGRPHRRSSPDHFIYWNEENRSRAYGHMCFLGLTNLVEPFYNGFANTPFWDDYPSNYALAQQVFDQGGAVSYAHPGYAATFEGASIKEMPVDLALGQPTAMDVLSNNPENATTELWYRLLNCGFRVAISAGTDSFTNVADHYTAGGGRVYVKIGPRFDYAAWLKAYREGRSFASNGPIVTLSVNGKAPGDEIRLDSGAELTVEGLVETQVPLGAVDLIVNGRAVFTQPATGSRKVALNRKIRIDESSWIALRALGPRHRLILNDAGAFAHTSPVYVTVAGRPVRIAEDIRFYRDWVERLIDRTDKNGRFKTPAQKNEVLALFRKALNYYHPHPHKH